jgi:hypothetical protein
MFQLLMENRDFSVKNSPKGAYESVQAVVLKPEDLPKSSFKASNPNRKTQFTLGNCKPTVKTEASSHYKLHELRHSETPGRGLSEIKAHHFSLGSDSNHYETTASASFVTYKQFKSSQICQNPSNNIKFGADKAKMKSIGQTEFNQKVPEKISKETMLKIKDNHRSSHFIVGNFGPSYITTNKDFKASTPTALKRLQPDTTPHVVFGNFKQSHVTEKQENFIKKEIFVVNSESIGKDMRKSHILMGKEHSVPLPTSVETYQGKQQNIIKPIEKDYKTSISFGSINGKWESSYKSNYSSRNSTPNHNYKPNIGSNISFGNDKLTVITTAQESFQPSKGVVYDHLQQTKNNSFSLGDFRRKFETTNKSYGRNSGKPSKIDQETLKKITACHFTYGNFERELKSKFQDDYGSPPALPTKVDLKENANNTSNVSFGEKQSSWESTYKKTFIKLHKT